MTLPGDAPAFPSGKNNGGDAREWFPEPTAAEMLCRFRRGPPSHFAGRGRRRGDEAGRTRGADAGREHLARMLCAPPARQPVRDRIGSNPPAAQGCAGFAGASGFPGLLQYSRPDL